MQWNHAPNVSSLRNPVLGDQIPHTCFAAALLHDLFKALQQRAASNEQLAFETSTEGSMSNDHSHATSFRLQVASGIATPTSESPQLTQTKRSLQLLQPRQQERNDGKAEERRE